MMHLNFSLRSNFKESYHFEFYSIETNCWYYLKLLSINLLSLFTLFEIIEYIKIFLNIFTDNLTIAVVLAISLLVNLIAITVLVRSSFGATLKERVYFYHSAGELFLSTGTQFEL